MKFKVTGGLNEIGNSIDHKSVANSLGAGARGCQRFGTFGKENIEVLEATYKRIEAVTGFGSMRNINKR